VSPKYNVELSPKPTVGLSNPTLNIPSLTSSTDVTLVAILTLDPLIPFNANWPPPAYTGGAMLGPF